MNPTPSIMSKPSASGRFGDFGGRFVPETLVPACQELEAAFTEAWSDPIFRAELDSILKEYAGRPSILTECHQLGARLGIRLLLKREDLNHTGAHKINNPVGQALLAVHMGKTRVIAETGAGQHGVATATVAARFGLKCQVYMGADDIERQSPNVFRMKLLGAEVIPVTSGSRTLKDAMNEALRDWVTHVDDTHYIIGTAAGPHPYPMIVRDLQAIIGRETREQCLSMLGRMPEVLVACVGVGSNAIGLFHPFLHDVGVRMVGVEAGGEGIASGRHAAPLSIGLRGVLHGNRTYLMSDEDGLIQDTHSVSAGLDYPGVGPEHAALLSSGRAEYVGASDEEALVAFDRLCRLEGIIPALETSHALVIAERIARDLGPSGDVLVGLSGRGDKDVDQIAARRGDA